MLDVELAVPIVGRRSEIRVTRLHLAWVATSVFLLMVTKGPVFWIRREAAPVTGDFIDDIWVQVAFVSASATVIALAWPARASLATDRRLVVPFGVFVTTLLISTLWSVDRTRTSEQAVMFLLGTAAALLTGRYLGIVRLLTALWVALQIGVGLSLWAVFRDWTLAFDSNDDMAGVYFNRNSLGPVALLAAASSVAFGWLALRSVHRWFAGLILAVGVTDVAVSQRAGSTTPVFAVTVASIVTCFVLLLRWGPSAGARRAIGAIALITVAGSIVAVAATWSDLMRRTANFSHRTIIWDVVLGFVADRPVHGYGFMALWTRDVMYDTLYPRVAVVYEAHSGYLEVLLGAGAIGLLALVATIVMVIRRTLAPLWRRPDLQNVWTLWIVVYVVAINLAETFIGANLLPWILLSAVAGAVASTND